MSGKFVIDHYNEPLWDSGGFTRPNGRFEANGQNQLAFVPNDLPPDMSYDDELIMLLVQAERSVAELKGMGNELENPHVLIRAHLKREAVLSSRMEGTPASLEDLNVYEAIGNVEKNVADRLRLREVANHVHALEDALKKIESPSRPVDLDVIREAHRTLMSGVMGGDNPGEFRTIQNWIAETRGTAQTVVYAPPPPERVPDLLRNLEEFLRTGHNRISALIQCAIIHYQFEAIHPFLDGNGRIGRLLLPPILYKSGLLPKPLLYLSAYFDRHRQEYYNGLQDINQKSMWNEWIKFFLRAFAEQADETIRRIRRLLDLEGRYREILRKNTGSKEVVLAGHLFANPYITIPRAGEFLRVTYPSAKRVITVLAGVGILEQTDTAGRGKVFVAKEIRDILNTD